MKGIFKISGFKLSLIVTLLFMSLYLWFYLGFGTSSFMNLIDKKIIDFVLISRGVTLKDNQVVIVAIDTKAVDKYGRWPWGRDIMAVLLKELETYYKVKIVGYDIVFSEPDPNDVTTKKVLNRFQKLAFQQTRDYATRSIINNVRSKVNGEMENDVRFGAELSKWGNIVLGYFFFPDIERVKHLTKEELRSSGERIKNSAITIIQGANFLTYLPLYEGQAVESNISLLVSPKNQSGYFNVFPDMEDGVVRRVHLVMKYGDKYYPSLDVQILRRYYGNPPIKLILNEGGIEGLQLGDKFISTNSDGSVMINYKGGAYTFPNYSVYDIINHLVPKEKLKDKIILLGATEVGVFDLRTTPVGVDFPGVEVHANLLDNIIHDDYLHQSEFVDFISFILILLVGLAMGIFLPRMRALSGFIFTLALLISFIVLNLWYLNRDNVWFSFSYIIGVIIINWFTIIMFKYFGEEKDKRFIKGAFQHYLSPQVIERLVDNPNLLNLGGEKKILTAFFSDIQGFSTVSESLLPEELVELLNEYLTAMTDIIMQYGGTVDKFEGDAIIAFFGAPLEVPDHALKACLTTIDMQKKLIEMRKVWKEKGKNELYVRIGLNTGKMVVGNMGSAYRMDYTMMGDSVNLAARLEGVNKEYKTFSMISQYTYDEVKDQIEVRELDMIRVVGKEEPVRIYEILGQKGSVAEDTLKAMKFFEKGLELYRNQQWREAYKHFAQVNKMLEEDGASQIFMIRCKRFDKKSPGENWDGVFQMTSK